MFVDVFYYWYSLLAYLCIFLLIGAHLFSMCWEKWAFIGRVFVLRKFLIWSPVFSQAHFFNFLKLSLRTARLWERECGTCARTFWCCTRCWPNKLQEFTLFSLYCSEIKKEIHFEHKKSKNNEGDWFLIFKKKLIVYQVLFEGGE